MAASPLSRDISKESVAGLSTVPFCGKKSDMPPFDSLMLHSGSISAADLCEVCSTDISPMAAAHTLVSVMAAGMAPPDAERVKRGAEQMCFKNLDNKCTGGCGRKHISLQGLKAIVESVLNGKTLGAPHLLYKHIMLAVNDRDKARQYVMIMRRQFNRGKQMIEHQSNPSLSTSSSLAPTREFLHPLELLPLPLLALLQILVTMPPALLSIRFMYLTLLSLDLLYRSLVR